MKKIVLLILALFCLKGVPALADEGMWVPALIQSRIKDMKAKGFKLTAEDIYSINRSSLKDAVLLFGSGCTGEVISDEGLFLTNHHCGYYFIGSHSSVEHDYLTNGFWAMNRSEELPNPGLTVSFLIRMEDVTDRALKGVGDEMPQAERDSMVKANAAGVIAKATAGTHYEAAVEPFYYGNQYFLFVYEKFRDVRLVAAVGLLAGNGQFDRGGGGQSDIDDIHPAAAERTFDDRGGHFAREARIAADYDLQPASRMLSFEPFGISRCEFYEIQRGEVVAGRSADGSANAGNGFNQCHTV